jgi:hypothetical protein
LVYRSEVYTIAEITSEIEENGSEMEEIIPEEDEAR